MGYEPPSYPAIDYRLLRQATLENDQSGALLDLGSAVQGRTVIGGEEVHAICLLAADANPGPRHPKRRGRPGAGTWEYAVAQIRREFERVAGA